MVWFFFSQYLSKTQWVRIDQRSDYLYIVLSLQQKNSIQTGKGKSLNTHPPTHTHTHTCSHILIWSMQRSLMFLLSSPILHCLLTTNIFRIIISVLFVIIFICTLSFPHHTLKVSLLRRAWSKDFASWSPCEEILCITHESWRLMSIQPEYWRVTSGDGADPPGKVYNNVPLASY